jgi:hypothetical protein
MLLIDKPAKIRIKLHNRKIFEISLNFQIYIMQTDLQFPLS